MDEKALNKKLKLKPEQIKCLNMLSRGYTAKETAKIVGINEATVYVWIKRYKMRQMIKDMKAFPVAVDAQRILAKNITVAIELRDNELEKEDGGDPTLILKCCQTIHTLAQSFITENDTQKLTLIKNVINMGDVFGGNNKADKRVIEAAGRCSESIPKRSEECSNAGGDQKR